jgi:hypothetical protein
MHWEHLRGGRAVLHTQIRLKNGTFFHRPLDTDDSELARIRIVPFIKKLIAAGWLAPDSQVAKLYLDRTITDAEIERGPPSTKAPPCMLWHSGADLLDGGGQPGRGRPKGGLQVLHARVALNDGTHILTCLNTRDKTVAAERLRPLVAKAIADGKLSPRSKAARIYGGAAPTAPSAKTERVKGSPGRKSKWIDGARVVAPDALIFHDVVKAARQSDGPVNAAIDKAWDQIPSSQKMSSFGKPLNRRTLVNRFFDIERMLSGNPGR